MSRCAGLDPVDGAAHLEAVKGDRAGSGLDRYRLVAVAVAGPSALTTGVALAAKELGDLSLQRRLEQQPGPQPSDILQHLTQITVGGKQLVDLGADALGG
jgi:hypothetical protein